jgi:hypothetical protein
MEAGARAEKGSRGTKMVYTIALIDSREVEIDKKNWYIKQLNRWE